MNNSTKMDKQRLSNRAIKKLCLGSQIGIAGKGTSEALDAISAEMELRIKENNEQ